MFDFGQKVSKEEAKVKLGLDPNDTYMLFFGFIRRYKGLDLLLEAMADARIKNKNLKLIVAGEYYEDGAYYENKLKEYGVEDKVKMHTNYIPSDMVRYYFSAADIVVQPYRSATQSGVTQIAYHFDKPMLVTNVGGLAEIVPDGKVGYVVQPNATAIADAINDFYDNKSLLTVSEIILPSALPANCLVATPITLPISAGVDAPTCVIIALSAASSSCWLICLGRKLSITDTWKSSASASSGRPCSLYISADSLRCFTIFISAFASASSLVPFSDDLSNKISDFIARNASKDLVSLASMAFFISAFIFSSKVMVFDFIKDPLRI